MLFPAEQQQQRLFPGVMSQLLKMIHRAACEHFHEGTIFFTYRSAGRRVHPLMATSSAEL